MFLKILLMLSSLWCQYCPACEIQTVLTNGHLSTENVSVKPFHSYLTPFRLRFHKAVVGLLSSPFQAHIAFRNHYQGSTIWNDVCNYIQVHAAPVSPPSTTGRLLLYLDKVVMLERPISLFYHASGVPYSNTPCLLAPRPCYSIFNGTFNLNITLIGKGTNEHGGGGL